MSSPDPSLPPDAVTGAQPAPSRSEAHPDLPPDGGENPPWNFWDVLRLAAIALITIVLFGMIAMAFAAHGDRSKEMAEKLAVSPKVIIPARVLAYLVILGYMIAIVRTSGREFWATVKWNFSARNAIGFAALGIAMAVLIQTASALLPIPKSLPIDKFFTDAAGAYLMAAFGVTFAPLLEELFFRGFLYPVMARKLGVAASVAITALAFALLHAEQLAGAWSPLLLLWIVGVVLTAVRARSRSVGASFCVHVGYNFTLFLMLYFASDHFRHLERLS